MAKSLSPSDRISATRRRFLQQGSLLALSGLLPLRAWADGTRVVVVGAGLAGLHAALLLESQGVDVLVLEGRERVGGRLYTLDHIPGRPEGGGNTIGPNYGRVIDRAGSLGVELEIPPRPAGGMGLLIDGRQIHRDDWAESEINSLPEAVRAVAPDRLRGAALQDNPLTTSVQWRSTDMIEYDISAAEHFRRLGFDDASLRLLEVNNSYGNRLEDTSLLMLYRVGGAIGRAIAMRQPAFQVAGGNMRLPEAMAGALRAEVRTGETVRRIAQTAAGLSLECASGNQFDADFAICALPATALREIAFEPGLPAEQMQALSDVEYQKVTQAHLVAETAYWESEGRPGSLWTNGPLGRIFARPVPDGSGRQNITVWITGDSCDRFDVMGEDEAGEAILNAFTDISPGAREQVTLGGVVRWAPDPFNQGAWAVWRPGQASRLPARMQQAHGRLFFAGEHLSVANSGLEAAMESGERAALDVMRRLA